MTLPARSTGLGLSAVAALFALLVSPALRGQSLPDLAVTDLRVNENCQIVVTLKNNGPGELPITAYDQFQGPTVNFRKDGAAFGGWRLNSADPGKLLRQPGGTVTWTRGELKLAGTATISVSVDDNQLVTETSEGNNVLSKSLTCTPKLPDLAITNITFSPDCRTMIHLRNDGDAPLPSSAFAGGGVYLQRYLDGNPGGSVWLSAADPGKATLNPGGTAVYTDGADYRAARSVRYVLTNLGQEKSTANNAREAGVPANCAVQTAPKVDLTVTAVSVDKECRVVVTLKNNGPDGLPVTAYDPYQGPTVNFRKNGAPFGGWRLNSVDPGKLLRQPGGTVTWTRGELKFQGSAGISVTIDGNNVLPETNEANNTMAQSLSCSPVLPDLAVTGIGFTRDCRAVVTLRNLGKGPVPNPVFVGGGAYLQRYLDNIPGGSVFLSQVDPGKALQPPGGSRSFTDGAEYKAKNTVKYQLVNVGQEMSTANNALQVSLPPQCRTGAGARPSLPGRPGPSRQVR